MIEYTGERRLGARGIAVRQREALLHAAKVIEDAADMAADRMAAIIRPTRPIGILVVMNVGKT